ncbi:MAG: DUF3078 domain-containing protein [Chitinophagaceae bacterium]|nr:DUF3078 domain-containing protein [Chitinophagaceae bacterium]
MKKIVINILLLIFFFATMAQDPTVKQIQKESERKSEKDTISGWRRGGVISLNIGQGSSRNWAAGAEKFSFSTAASLSVFANKTDGKFYWNNALDLGYAIVNTHSVGSRKTDDKIDFFTKMGRHISNTFSVAGVINFRSQFTNGYDYNYIGKGLRRRTSSFLSPAYLIIAPGIDWHPKEYFSLFFSPVSVRMVIVTNEPRSYFYPGGIIPAAGGFEVPLSVLYGVDPQRKVRTELGGFLSANFNKDIIRNVSFKSRLDLYSNYLRPSRFTVTAADQVQTFKTSSSPEKIDVFWSNLLAMKVNKFLIVTYNLDLIYDDDVRQFGPNRSSPGTQLRSLLGVGFSAKF